MSLLINLKQPMEKRTLSFDLSHAKEEKEFTVHACLKEYRLQQHTPETLRQARKKQAFLSLIPDGRLTHFIKDLPLPKGVPALVHVTSPKRVDGHVVHMIETMHIHIPRASQERMRQQLLQRRRADGLLRSAIHPKLAMYGANAGDPNNVVPDLPYPPDVDDQQDAYETARALLFHHRDLLNINPTNQGEMSAWIIANCIDDNPGLGELAFQIYQSALDGGWSVEVPVLDENGKQMKDDGQMLWSQKPVPDVLSALRGPMEWAVRRAKQAPETEGQSWTVQYGVPSASYNASSSSPTSPKAGAPPSELDVTGAKAVNEAAPLAEAGAVGAVPYKWTLKNLTPYNGLSVDANSLRYKPPSTNKTWSATGTWSANDPKMPLTSALAKELLAGNLMVKLVTPDRAQGLLGAKLKPTAIVENVEVKFSPVTMSGSGLTPPVTTTATATGTFALNGARTGLTFQVTASLGDAASAVINICDAKGTAVSPPFIVTNMSGYGTLTFDCKNYWLRHLCAYVQFLDDANPPNVITPSPWNEQMPGFIRSMFQPNDSKKYIQMVSPVTTICGIPLPADPTTLSIPVPDNVHTVRVMWGGLGRGQYDKDVCAMGITLTVTLELALPMILLLAGTAISNSKSVVALMEDKETLFGVVAVGSFLVAGGVATEIGVTHNPKPALARLASSLGPLLLKTGLKWFITTHIAAGIAKRAIPFVNIAFEVFNGAVTAAQLSQTIIEVLESPFYYETDISKSVDLSITLVPDPNFHFFPPLATHYSVKVVYASTATYPTFDDRGSWSSTTQSEPFTVTFKNAPAGGMLKVYAIFYAANDWVAGQGESDWIEAKANSTSAANEPVLQIDKLVITNNKPPLTSASVYTHKEKLTYAKFDAQGKPSSSGTYQHGWIASPAPTATPNTAPPKEGHAITALRGLTMAQSPAQIAYAWEATGLNVPKDVPSAPSTNNAITTLQNMSILQKPQTGYSVPQVGFSGPANVVYDIASPSDGTGMNFFIDTTAGVYDAVTNPKGGYHLRQVKLSYPAEPPNLATATNRSWGCFYLDNDRYAYHPKGYVFGISFKTSKLEILKLPTQPSSDADAPRTTLASGESGTDQRYGLMYGPVALGIALDGRVLVLESVNNRVQAFDLTGVPVKSFKITTANPPPPNFAPDPTGMQSTMALIDPPNTVHYLDLAVEAKGYIYVLAYSGDGSQASQYKVDIYNPDGSHLVTTNGVAAGAIFVDLLRDMFTLNFETILGANNRTEPSISWWIPPAPPKS